MDVCFFSFTGMSHTAFNISYIHTTLGTLRFLTWNMCGAGSRERRLKIFNQLKELQANIFLLQELHRPVTATDEPETPEFPNVFATCYNYREREIVLKYLI